MSERLYLRPTALVSGPEAARLVAASTALPLAGGPLAFTAVERIAWGGEGEPRRETLPAIAFDPGQLTAVTSPRPAPFDRPRIMGILNVTPDSFSDGGTHGDAGAAIAHGLRLIEQGAAIIDVGGESTRPGAMPVPVQEELRRVLPVVEGLARAGVLVSIDTRKAAVMRAATAAGARIVNDVSGLGFDREAPAAAAEAAAQGAWVVLMHMRGAPATMNLRPIYRACILEVYDELAARIGVARAAGVPVDRLIVDPGLCFAKQEPQNVEILRDLALLHGLGCPVMIGVSRKGWAGWIESAHPSTDRLPSSLTAAQCALDRGIRLVRAHDVAESRQMMLAWTTLAD